MILLDFLSGNVSDAGQAQSEAHRVGSPKLHLPAAPRAAMQPWNESSRAATAIPEDEMASWFVVLHYANDGPRVRHRIRSIALPGDAAYEVHWPRFIQRLPRKDDVIRPLYPGYMFVRVPEGVSWGPIRRVPNVVRLLHDLNGHPVPVPDALVQRHIDRAGGAVDGLIDETPESIARFRAKQRLQVTSGPFEGWEGVCQLDDGDRVKMFLTMLGGERLVTLARNAVVPK